MIELYFNDNQELKIFFLLLNRTKGLKRKEIVKELIIPRTTCFEKLEKMIHRKITIDSVKYPYVIKLPEYFIRNTPVRRGAPYKIFFIPKKLRNTFYTFNIEKIKVKDTIIPLNTKNTKLYEKF